MTRSIRILGAQKTSMPSCYLSAPNIYRALYHMKTIDEGSDVTLICNATGYPQPFIRWIRAGGAPLPNGDSYFSVSPLWNHLLSSASIGLLAIYRDVNSAPLSPLSLFSALLLSHLFCFSTHRIFIALIDQAFMTK